MLENQIIYEDNHLLVYNKMAGEIVQEDKTGDVSILANLQKFIKNRDQKPGNAFVGVVHRLDRPVSGLLIFAKSSKAQTRLNEMLQKKEIKKVYHAIVKNKPPNNEDELIHYLKRNQQKNKTVVSNANDKDSKWSKLSYKILANSDRYYLLEIQLETGRHHQIRSQLSAIGCPIKGDLKYGAERSNDDGSISLHAYQISFIHPVKKELLTFKMPKNNDAIWQYFENLSIY
jgi:23S rRNA pseudouridine1911/1915/1917 synthase